MTWVREEHSITEEIAVKDFGYAEDKMAMRYGFEGFLAKPLTKFH